MSEQINIDPDRKLFTLGEAAAISKKSIQELLEAAAREEIELLFECPAGQVISLLTGETASSWSPLAGSAAFPKTPEYFVVRPQLCGALLHRTYVEIYDAERGYKTSGYTPNHRFTNMERLDAADAGSSEYFPVQAEANAGKLLRLPFGSYWMKWAFRSGTATTSHRARADDLFVIAQDFYRWFYKGSEISRLHKKGEEWTDEKIDELAAFLKKVNPDTGQLYLSKEIAKLLGVSESLISRKTKARKLAKKKVAQDPLSHFVSQRKESASKKNE